MHWAINLYPFCFNDSLRFTNMEHTIYCFQYRLIYWKCKLPWILQSEINALQHSSVDLEHITFLWNSLLFDILLIYWCGSGAVVTHHLWMEGTDQEMERVIPWMSLQLVWLTWFYLYVCLAVKREIPHREHVDWAQQNRTEPSPAEWHLKQKKCICACCWVKSWTALYKKMEEKSPIKPSTQSHSSKPANFHINIHIHKSIHKNAIHMASPLRNAKHMVYKERICRPPLTKSTVKQKKTWTKNIVILFHVTVSFRVRASKYEPRPERWAPQHFLWVKWEMFGGGAPLTPCISSWQASSPVKACP